MKYERMIPKPTSVILALFRDTGKSFRIKYFMWEEDLKWITPCEIFVFILLLSVMSTFLRVVVPCHIQAFLGASMFTKESDPMPRHVVQKLRVADPPRGSQDYLKGPPIIHKTSQQVLLRQSDLGVFCCYCCVQQTRVHCAWVTDFRHVSVSRIGPNLKLSY